MPDTKLRRTVTAQSLQVRTTAGGLTIEGHASTFDQPYDMGWYTETVAPGAFTRTLAKNPDVRLLVNHDGLPLARTSSGTLDLSQDKSGLYMRSTLDRDDPDVRRLAPKMARGDLNQMSFSFGLSKNGDEWSEDLSNRTLRHLSLDGGDVSIVTFPANPNATVAMRSRILRMPKKLRELYRTLDPSSEARALLDNLTTADDLTTLETLMNGSTATQRHIARIRLAILRSA